MFYDGAYRKFYANVAQRGVKFISDSVRVAWCHIFDVSSSFEATI